MLKEAVFDLENFNIYSDNENYYFFRALNLADNADFDNGIITDQDNQIVKIRTNLDRYDKVPMYSSEDEISLDQVVNHIKMHQRKDTNCISLTSNANTALTYGRSGYKDKYVMIKVPKNEIGENVYQAGLYMLQEVSSKIDEIILNGVIDEFQKYFIDFINNAKSQESLDKVKEMLPREYASTEELYEKGLEFDFTTSKNFIALNEQQNLEKNKIIMKLDVLKKQILPAVSNRFLIQTIGNAFSSLELIHYGEIDKDKIVNVSSEFIDILGLVQQLPEDLKYLDEFKEELIKNSDKFVGKVTFPYKDFSIVEKELSLNKLYELTGGNVDYKTAYNMYKKAFYLSKSKLRMRDSIELLNKTLGSDSKYKEIIEYMKNHTYGIEPEITTRLSKDLINVSESVSLDFNEKEKTLFNFVDGLDNDVLEEIINKPFETIQALLATFEEQNKFIKDLSKEEWFANSIVDLIDFKSLGVKDKLSERQRKDIIETLIEHNFLQVYERIKEINSDLSDKEIANVLITNLIRDREEIDLNDRFTLKELEYFVGYNTLKDTKLKLINDQPRVALNLDRIFVDRQFASAIMPTGTGKSYIALDQMYKHQNEKILYLAPNVEILNQLKNVIIKTYNPEQHFGDTDDEIIKNIFPNLTLGTYQDLKDNSKEVNNNSEDLDEKSEICIKEKYGNDYGLIILDELHRTGAENWSEQVRVLLNNQVGFEKDGEKKKVRVLGITATPERDVDFINMAERWASYYGYTDEEIANEEYSASNMDIERAIRLGIVANPKVLNCEYTLVADGSMDSLKEKINDLRDEDVKKEKMLKYEMIRRNIEKSSGIEKTLHDNLKSDGKYIVFLPVTKRNGVYEDEDGNAVDKSTAEKIIKDYQALMRQYFFSYDYFEKEGEKINNIYSKILSNEELSMDELKYLEDEKDNILLLNKIDIKNKPSALITEYNQIADTIINHMMWEPLPITKQTHLLKKMTSDQVEDYSMLGSYSDKTNEGNLINFNRPTKGKKKMMFVMNKLNEGVHPEGINGIIWLRPLSKESRILYLQQLGRCISAIKPGQQIKDEDRPVVLDFVNNTLHVDFKRGELQEKKDLDLLLEIQAWIESNNGNLPRENVGSEQGYAKNLIRINERYSKYFFDNQLLDDLNPTNRILIKKIIENGCDIDLWTYVEEEKDKVKGSSNNGFSDKDDSLVGMLEINSIMRDFIDLSDEVDEQEARDFEFYLDKMKKFRENGGDVFELASADKFKENKDGTISLVKRGTEGYDDKNLISIGSYLIRHKLEFTTPQVEQLGDVGYIIDPVEREKEKARRKFEKNLNLMKRFRKNGGEVLGLVSDDKFRENKDGTISLVKRGTEGYDDKNLISISSYLSRHKLEFTTSQVEQLGEVGYIVVPVEREKEKARREFEKNLNLMKKFRENGGDVFELVSEDKFRENKDGTISLVKKGTEGYGDENLIRIGSYLDGHKLEFTTSQVEQLGEIGYIVDPVEREKEKARREFEKNLNLMKKFRENGGDVFELVSNDKFRENRDDGTVSLVKYWSEGYGDENLIRIGSYLDGHKLKFTTSQVEQLGEVGYIVDPVEREKEKARREFEKNLNLMKKFKKQGGEVLGLASADKFRENKNDGTVSLVKRGTEGYDDKNLICIGRYLDGHKLEFTTSQVEQLGDVGYIVDPVEREKEKARREFEKNLNLMKKFKEQGGEVFDLVRTDKFRENKDGTISLVKMKVKGKGENKIVINRDEYDDKNLICIGSYLNSHKDKFTDIQIKQLEEIGYIIDKKKNKKDIADICERYSIPQKQNKDLLGHISYQELEAKIKFLNGLSEQDASIELVDENGVLHPMFRMRNKELKKQYGVTVQDLIKSPKENQSGKKVL